MENHPIPQDITGFQFKLIGNMTIKQFAYLASGVIVGWILASIPITPFIKVPIAVLFVLFGASLAFIPISGRPMDIMIVNFGKSFFAPTQFIYIKKGGKLFPPLAKPTLQKTSLLKKQQTTLIMQASLGAPNPLDEKEMIFLKGVANLLNINPLPTTHALSINQPKPPIPTPITTTYPKIKTQTVRPIAKGMEKKVGFLTTPDAPNLITGIVKNPRGFPVPNILIEIKDKEGNPVRAFKTNGLGQFASATSLINGTYTITLEDPKEENKFEPIELKLTGGIVLPIEVVSIDTREELRRSLFGNTKP